MIDVETQWMIFLLFTLVPAAFIVSIVAGWIFDYRERQRVRRILGERNLSFEGNGRVKVDVNALLRSPQVREQIEAIRRIKSQSDPDHQK